MLQEIVDQEPFTHTTLTDAQFFQGKLLHEGIENRGPGNDDISAFRVEPWHLTAALQW